VTYELLGNRADDETADHAVGAAPNDDRPRCIPSGRCDQRGGRIARGHLEPPVHAPRSEYILAALTARCLDRIERAGGRELGSEAASAARMYSAVPSTPTTTAMPLVLVQPHCRHSYCGGVSPIA
jgi:hypothetical protein